ncbi:MAG: divalent-cation tolerance protein CutA [Candidatus Aureabacteria bacterium]|nr:divalent-cation tolerance protein CutA [Candidatus Auribacterota bacterium]
MMSPKQNAAVVVLMTCAGKNEAREIADALLREKAAACVSIFPKGESFFWWEGKIDRAEEFLLVAKTVVRALPRLVALVKRNHSYQVPEIVALPIVGGNPEYLQWLEEETRGKAEVRRQKQKARSM